MSDGGELEGRWASDPSGRHDYRYWDGSEWTGHVVDGGLLPTAPPAPHQGAQPPPSWFQPSGASGTGIPVDDVFGRTGGYAAEAGFSTGSEPEERDWAP